FMRCIDSEIVYCFRCVDDALANTGWLPANNTTTNLNDIRLDFDNDIPSLMTDPSTLVVIIHKLANTNNKFRYDFVVSKGILARFAGWELPVKPDAQDLSSFSFNTSSTDFWYAVKTTDVTWIVSRSDESE